MEKHEIPDCFYRISVKALVLNETRDKFLITKESDGQWELPGGGLDWGMGVHEELKREIREEMGLETTWIADHPCYFLTGQTRRRKVWIANLLYETELASLDFTPSDECTEIRFVDENDIGSLTVFPTVADLAKIFNPSRHARGN